MATLRTLLSDRAAASKRSAIRYQERDYQIKLARAAYARLTSGCNVIVDLPTGAGKTNVAFICALSFITEPGGARYRVPYIVPTRILIAQVVRAGAWLGDTLLRVAVTTQLTSNTFSLRGAIAGHHVPVTTPGLFASSLRSGRIDRRAFVREVPFVIVDEFDEFLTVDIVEHGMRARIENDFQELLDVIEGKPLLLMSGTTPAAGAGLTHSLTASELARFTEKRFEPVRVTAKESSYRKYIPLAHVHITAVKDEFVANANAALKQRLRNTIQNFECENRERLDASYLLDRAAGIASGTVRQYRRPDGRFVPITRKVHRLCLALLDTMGMFPFLFEDMFANFDVEYRATPILDMCEVVGITEAPFLVDRRHANEFLPLLRAKAHSLIDVIRRHGSEKGVVFTRNTRLSDALEAEIKTVIGCPVITVDGRLSENQRYSRITQFSTQKTSILILTRTTGKRGLDIPAADYAVLYSPKEDEYVVWQELSRIRSTLGASKPSYLLLYSGTAEEERAQRLVQDMRGSVHRYRFSTSGS